MQIKRSIKFDEYTGMRLGLVGLLVAVIGTALAFTVFPNAGYWIGLTGALMGIAGAGFHWYKNWRTIFDLNHD